MAHIAVLRSETGWATAADVRGLFEALRIPTPANVPRDMGRLKDRGYLVKRSDGSAWAVTPTGEQKVNELIGRLDLAALLPLLASVPGAKFGEAVHSVVPPELAPLRWAFEVSEFLEEYPFHVNVFCMTRFPKDESDTEYLDPIRHLIPVIRSVLAESGLRLLVASDRLIVDDLFGNVAAHMWVSKYGIGLLEDRIGRGLNYNVMTELGAMLMTGRRCALLKDRTAPDLPSDLGGHVYKPVDFDQETEIADAVRLWVRNDLRIAEA